MGKPIKYWRNKGIDVTAWPTKNDSVSFTIRKTYKPKGSNEYIESKSYFGNELKQLIDLLTEAYSWNQEFFAEEKQVIDSRPVDPRVQEVVRKVANAYPGSTVVDDDIPF